MIHVIATISLNPGTREEFLEVFRWLSPLVRKEQGCIEYQGTTDVPTTIPVQDALRQDVVTVVEKWASLDALKAHGAAPHMAAYAARTRDLIASRVIHVLSPV